MKIDYTLVSFENLKLSTRYAAKIRGYFGNKYKEIELMHNHKDKGFIFKYPKVQYKVIDDKPVICGINEGAKLAAKLGIVDDEILMDNELIDVSQKEIIKKTVEFGTAEDYIEYKFLTPWIALNQKNISMYKELNNIKKEEFLNRILIGNILSMAKGLDYTVEDKIHVWLNVKEINIKLKGISMKGFVGSFKTNFKIPNYLGLGKSVSRGFGAVKSLD